MMSQRGAVGFPRRRPTTLSSWSLSGLSVLRASSKPTTDQNSQLHCRPLHASNRPDFTMPPKQRTSVPQTVPGTPYSAVKSKSSNDAQDILPGVWNRYVEKTPQRTKLLDSFMLFLVVVGALQFAYVVLVGNFVSPTLMDLCTFVVRLTCRALLTLG